MYIVITINRITRTFETKDSRNTCEKK